MIHTKNGQTYTSRDAYPWDVPEDEITSVERIVDGTVYTIKKSKSLHHFFVKTTAGKTFSPFSGSTEDVIHERIIGCYIDGKDGPVRLEMVVDPNTGNVKLSATKVSRVRKDGF